MRRAMIRPMNVLRALKPMWFVPLLLAYPVVVFAVDLGLGLPGPEWIYMVIIVLPMAIGALMLGAALIMVFFYAGSFVVNLVFRKQLRRRAQEREIRRTRETREALRIKPAGDPGISHTALVRSVLALELSVRGSPSLVEDLIQGLVDSGELECVQKGRVRRYFVGPVRAEIENAGVGPTP